MPEAGATDAARGWWAPGRRLRTTTIGALVLSLIIHAVLALIAALIAVGWGAGLGSSRDDGVEFAVVSEAQLASLQQAALELQTPPVPEIRAAEEMPSIEIASEVASSLDLSTDLDALIGAGDITQGAAGAGLSGSGGGGAANFFGLEAQGTRFAYIVDVSGSMDGARLTVLQRELTRSIESLPEQGEFVVVFFNSDAHVLGRVTQWTRASDSQKRVARSAIAEVRAGGGTNPLPAFEIVFALRPKPDAIYLMTDGEFQSPTDVEVRVLGLNSERRVPIHCITFVSDVSADVMRRIASRSGGSYTHVPGPGG